MRKRLAVIPGLVITIIFGSCMLAVAQKQPPPQPVDGDQQLQPRAPRPPEDPLAGDMFPPEMIMQHQRELALTDAQKTFMLGEMQRTSNRFNELLWQQQDAMEALHETMKGSQVNEQQALAQLNKVLDTEREIKLLHMAMNIHIKNQLTSEQQVKLQTIRSTQSDGQRRDRRPGGPDGGGRRPDGMRPPGGPEGMRPPGGLGGPPNGGPPPGGGGRRP